MTEIAHQAGPRSFGSLQNSQPSVQALVPVGRVPGLLRVTIIFALASTLLLGRFQLNVGSYFLNVGLLAQYLLVLALIIEGMGRIDPIRLMLFIACTCITLISLVVNSNVASQSSVLLIIATYLVFIFVARSPDGTDHLARWTLAVFGNLMLFCAAVGILQFFLQFVMKAPWLFDFTQDIPETFRGGGIYNTVIRVHGFFKSNGFFFREPSRFSQFLALALLIEFATQKRWRLIRISTLGLAILLSYSGTGLLTLFFGLLFPLSRRTLIRLIAIAIGGALVFSVLGGALNLSVTTGRLNEFTYVGSSGFARFVAPFTFVRDYIDSTPWSLMIGHGPGSIFKTIASSGVDYEVAGPTWAKLVSEYGVLGFVAFVGLLVFSMLRSCAPAELRAAVPMGWFILWGGVLLAPDATAILYMLVAVWPRQRITARPAPPSRSG